MASAAPTGLRTATELAAAAQHMTLNRGDDRLFHQPWGYLEFKLRMKVGVRLFRAAAPIVSARGLRPDIVTRTEAAVRGTQQHDAGVWFGIGLAESIEQRVLQFRTDCVEFVGTIKNN